MGLQDSQKKRLLYLLWLLEGIIVGFGAILPGVSGGTLCVAFGMYRPIVDTLSHLKSGIQRHGWMLLTFFLGVLAGFIALSGLAAWMLEHSAALVTCVFIGFILGTFPELWQEAGAQGRSGRSIWALCLGFAAMALLLGLLKTASSVVIPAKAPGFFLCGLLWGLSFIVPGLSSSSLLLFFGLYQPMLAGIASFNFSVLLPMGAGMALCVLLLSKGIARIYRTHYAAASHAILGIVAATAMMILPEWNGAAWSLLAGLAAICFGGALSYGLSRLCRKIKTNP
ncbi:MAG TPA: DUF368 domain-containing protein [Candidatus Faecousia intestinigallinarum]|nr:DUF368 domain-containing protein [Candidatus Faecousia intestinigallinarum]